MSTPYFTIPNVYGCPYWQPESQINNDIRTNLDITSNWKYRQYMQKNATQIMKYNVMESVYASGNNPYSLISSNEISENVPHRFASLHDTRVPNYGYNNSDLKQNFMKKQQFNSVLLSPSIPTENFK